MVHAVAAASLSMLRLMAFVRSSLAGEMTRTATNFVMSNTSPVSPLALLLLCGNLRAEEVGVAPRASLDCFLLGRGLLGKERDSRCDRGKYVGYIRSAATLVARCPPFRCQRSRDSFVQPVFPDWCPPKRQRNQSCTVLPPTGNSGLLSGLVGNAVELLASVF